MKRKVIEEGVYSKSLKVEVYPWHLKICENSKPDEQILKEFSRADTIGRPLFMPKLSGLVPFDVGTSKKELRALRGFFGPPLRLKNKTVFHHFVLISFLEQ